MNTEEEDMKRVLALPFRSFLEKCVQWKEDTETDLTDIDKEKCPVHQYATLKGRCFGVVGSIELCPACGNPLCPACGNHCVNQLSRVTGYLQAVGGWNEAKKQELQDRTRYDIERGTSTPGIRGGMK